MTPLKKHIVLITTWFPPIQGVAVNRMAAFAKYLDKTKFDISVLTLRENDAIEQEEMFGCKVIRLANDRFLKLPKFNSTDKKIKHYLKVAWKLTLLKTQKDIYSSWRKNVITELNQLHKIQRIHLVISSFSPETAHVVACEFCEENSTVRWIADMRDEMSQNPSISTSDKNKYLKIENRINKLADAVTTISQPHVQLFRETTMTNIRYVEEIRNGFDHDIVPTPNKFNDVFTIVYSGIFYGAHKPDIFFAAMEELEKENKLPSSWKIIFVGTSQSISIPERLKKNCEFVERVPQEKSVEYMMNADANLFMIPKLPRRGVYTGKLFDYLSVRKPIIAIVDKQDVAAELILQLNAGFVASNDNVEEVKEAVLNIYDVWNKKQNMKMDDEGIALLHSKFQVQKLNKLIEDLLNGN